MTTTIPASGNGRRNAPRNGGEKPRWNDLSQHPLDEGQGSYSKLPVLTEEEVKELKLWVSRSGWKINLQRAAFYVVDVAADARKGQRFQVPVRELAQALGMSTGSASSYMKQLREKGLLRMFRRHQIHYDETTGEYWGEATINQISPHFLENARSERFSEH